MLGEPDPLGSDAINVRSPDVLLPIAAELAVTKIVREEVDDVRFPSFLLRMAKGSQDSQNNGSDQEAVKNHCRAHHIEVSVGSLNVER